MSPPVENRGAIELRLNSDHTPDDIVCPWPREEGSCRLVHVEQMDDNAWWMSIEDDSGHMLHLWFLSDAPIEAQANWV